MTLSPIDFGPGGSYRFSRNAGRSMTSEAVGSVRYPSPFFDIASTYLPSSYKSMLRWCRYYFLTNPLINSVVYKMAEYPVTDLIIDEDNTAVRDKWTHLFEDILQFKQFEVEAGLDYNAYGNTFISLFYPFQKYLVCKTCKQPTRIEQQKYVFRDFKFVGNCKRCGHYGPFKTKDHYIRSVRDIRLIRWNPEYITIQHNSATGESRYYYTIPATLANDIRLGKREIIERVPQVFIEALKKNKAILFSNDNIYHMKRPTIAQKDKGWGLPMILPVLKDTFYLQILRKAQEAIALEHIVPLRVIFPQSASSTSDVYSTVNLSAWRAKIEQELMRWRIDNNYIPIMPLPIGQQTLGGDGRALMLAQEYRVWAEHIISGMGVPIEFAFGGMQFSGSNVSLRMLENHFLDQKSDHLRLVRSFVIPNISAFMGWPSPKAHFKKFKMADDLQRSAFHLQLNQAGKLSDEAILEDTDWDSRREQKRIESEREHTIESQRRQALGQASIQGEAQLVIQKYQLRAQKVMSEAQAVPMDPMMSQDMQQMGMQAAGQPGVASPAAQGQAMIAEQGMMNQSGMIPPVAELTPQQGAPQGGAQQQGSPQAPLPAGVQSPVGMQQVGANVSIIELVNKIVAWLDRMPDNEKQVELTNIRQHNPQIYSLVLQVLNSRAGAHANSAAMPLPDKKPPRRGPEAAMV